jgi:hypothetical protein
VTICTGGGGCDTATGRQIADQQLVKGNKALAENLQFEFIAVKRTFRILRWSYQISQFSRLVDRSFGRSVPRRPARLIIFRNGSISP